MVVSYIAEVVFTLVCQSRGPVYLDRCGIAVGRPRKLHVIYNGAYSKYSPPQATPIDSRRASQAQCHGHGPLAVRVRGL